VLERFDLVVFDWDGTLADSTAAIVAAIQAAAADLGVPVPDQASAAHVIGLGLHDALARAVPSLPSERVGEFAAHYRTHYLAREPDLVLFDGAVDLLDRLRQRGAALAVATGKTRVGLDRALRTSGLLGRFDMTRCADESRAKPHPAMLEAIMAQLRVAPARTLMIGDTTHDLEMARSAGVPAVALTQGAHPRAALAALRPLAVLDSLPALQHWLMPPA
jgi:phosphoglycolate phosphatase